MIVLGLFGFGASPSACLLRDGELVAFAEEERFSRYKGSFGFFPGRAASFCLRQASVPLDAVDVVAWPWDADRYRYEMPLFFARKYLARGFSRSSRRDNSRNILRVLTELAQTRPAELEQKIQLGLRRAGHLGRMPKVEFVPHHLSHAYSSFHFSGLDEAAVVTLDGSGESVCTQIAHGCGRDVSVVESVEMPDSIGWVYSAFTEWLGFKPYSGEGKVMGLAPYGEPREELAEKVERIVKLDGDRYRVDPGYLLLGDHAFGEYFSDALVELFGPPRAPDDEITQEHRDVAYVVQEKLEELATAVVKRALRLTGSRNLCLAGGVALNCKMNGLLADLPEVERLFVQPAAGDAGVALGAAAYVSERAGHDTRRRLDRVDFGPAFSNDEVRAALEAGGVPYRPSDDVAAEAAELLAAGRIVAWHQGGMEFGPRALGHRSILANPADPAMKDVVNERVKFREPWRPFCPSLLDEARKDYLASGRFSAFMIVADQATPKAASAVPAVVHVDNSLRPQTVTEKANPLYHRLIRELGDRTGEPVVLNTSFNVRGEPIVCTPGEAIRCFWSNGLDALAIGDFIVEKKRS